MNILDSLIWCGNQSVDTDDRMICLAHLAEGRVPFCPYADQADRLRSPYPCSDYEPSSKRMLGLDG